MSAGRVWPAESKVPRKAHLTQVAHMVFLVLGLLGVPLALDISFMDIVQISITAAAKPQELMHTTPRGPGKQQEKFGGLLRRVMHPLQGKGVSWSVG